MKGIILAGGKGTRLYPLTKSISKQIIPIYDKPMIYYPLSILMLANIREVLIISTGRDLPIFQNLLGNGEKYGLKLEYKIQDEPNGLAEAFLLGDNFVENDSVALILGDNLFFGSHFSEILLEARELREGAKIFAYPVKNAQQYGVVEFDKNKNVLSIEEKPNIPKSNFVIPGLYFYDNTVVEKAKKLKPSARGELEITAINQMYLEEKKLQVHILGRGMTWFDTGTCEALLEAANFIEAIQKRQGFYIACIEEIAYKKGWISHEYLRKQTESLGNNEYSRYLFSLLREEHK